MTEPMAPDAPSVRPETHTPGPWEVADNGVGVVASALKGRMRWTDERGVDHDAPLGLVALVYSCHAVGGYDGPGALEANARLIAAAPELLDIARTIISICESGNRNLRELACDENSPLVGECRALVARITGASS